MAVHDNREFGQLFAAFTNADVTAEERARLNELAGQDVGRRGAIAEVEAVQELFAVEVAMRERVMQPVEPKEEADESFQRLAKAAARAGEKLRANLQHPPAARAFEPPATDTGDARRSLAWSLIVAIAAVVLIAMTVFVFGRNDGAPKISDQVPNDKVLAGVVIDVTTLITDDSPELSWSEVRAAASYEVSIVDTEQAVVLRRAEGRRFTKWTITTSDLDLLREREGALFVSVVARGRRGEQVGGTPQPARLEIR